MKTLSSKTEEEYRCHQAYWSCPVRRARVRRRRLWRRRRPRRRRQHGADRDTTGTPAQREPVTIAFSAPAADHGWMAAITDNARSRPRSSRASAQAHRGRHRLGGPGRPDRDADQRQAGRARRPAQRGRRADPGGPEGDRGRHPGHQRRPRVHDAGAYRTLITGDNYGIGWQAGNYFADELKCKGNVVEIQGIAGISVTEDARRASRTRSSGAARTASRSSPTSRPTSCRTRACR